MTQDSSPDRNGTALEHLCPSSDESLENTGTVPLNRASGILPTKAHSLHVVSPDNTEEECVDGQMPRKYKPIYLQKMEQYLEWLRKRSRAEVTIRDYRYTLEQFYYYLEGTQGLTTIPSQIGEDEVLAFLDKRKREIGKKYLQTQYRQLKGFFDYVGNKTLDELGLRFSTPPRPNATWLTQDEAERLVKAVKIPLEGLLVHLGLELGFRRVEMIRLKVDDIDFKEQVINVTGKGVDGGKSREVPFHPETETAFRIWLEERDKIIARALRKKPGISIPKEVILHSNRAWGLKGYRNTGLVHVIKGVVKRAGIETPCCFHTLRRTLGRAMYLNGVSIEIIAELFGHTNTKTTLIYIGINRIDMANALKNGALFRRKEK